MQSTFVQKLKINRAQIHVQKIGGGSRLDFKRTSQINKNRMSKRNGSGFFRVTSKKNNKTNITCSCAPKMSTLPEFQKPPPAFWLPMSRCFGASEQEQLWHCWTGIVSMGMIPVIPSHQKLSIGHSIRLND